MFVSLPEFNYNLHDFVIISMANVPLLIKYFIKPSELGTLGIIIFRGPVPAF